MMNYYTTLLSWALKLHLKRSARYRIDVLVWTVTIWMTIGIQACFVYVTYHATGGYFFGYSPKELMMFFGITLLVSGIAQSIIVGVILHLARAVWLGTFDFWILQPAPIFLRIMIEEIGLIWYWPHIVIGTAIILMTATPASLPLTFIAVFLAIILEIGVVFCLCIPSIRWGKWDPNDGVWEYIESSRSIPIGQTRQIMLWLASFGVLQYSIALQVATGRWPLWALAGIAFLVCSLAGILLSSFTRTYSSASS